MFQILYKVVSKVRTFIERLSQYAEMGVWNFRNIFVKSILILIFVPFGFWYYSFLEDTRIKSISTTVANPKIYLILYCLLVGGLVFELVTRYLNWTSSKNNKIGVPTLLDRVLSILPYLWIWLEATRVYQFQLIKHLKYNPQILYKVVPIIQSYENLPGHQFGLVTFLIFTFLFYGIGRNKTQFRFVVRYHSIQALLVEALIYFQSHIYLLWAERRVSDDILSENVALMIYSFILFSLVIFSFSALFGLQTRIPFLHQAVIYHTGEEKDDPYNII